MTRPTPKNKLRVTVLAGGPSPERDISLQSGQAVADALEKAGYRVNFRDINPHDLSALDVPNDVIFPALHGTFGEDGQLQQILESRRLCFVGSGSTASATAMDKPATKRAATDLGFSTPASAVLKRTDAIPLPPPVVIKPPAQGSSVHTYVCRTLEQADAALDSVAAAFGTALVEQFVPGTEITVGILFDQPLPPLRIKTPSGFYDFDAKYVAPSTEYLFETGLTESVLKQLALQSVALYNNLGCRHLARVDWIVDHAETPWLLELNTIPGFTSHSLVPKAAARIGVTFESLCTRLVETAWEEHQSWPA